MNGVCSCKATSGTLASTIFNFLNFQNHHEHVHNNLCKFYRSQTNGVCSCRERAPPGTPASTIFTFLNFQNHREHVYNNLCKFYHSQTNGVCPCREMATPGTPASTISKTCASMFTITCESFIAIGWTVCAPIRDRHTNTHTDIFYIIMLIKLAKPSRACLQQLLKVTSQSDEWCVLLVRQHRVLQLV